MYLSGFGSKTYLSSHREDENMRAVLCSLVLGFLLVLNTEGGWWSRRRRRAPPPCYRVNCQVGMRVLLAGLRDFSYLFTFLIRSILGVRGAPVLKNAVWAHSGAIVPSRGQRDAAAGLVLLHRLVHGLLEFFGLHCYCLG